LHVHKSISSEKHDDLEQFNTETEMFQFPENIAIGNKSIENVSSAPVPTKKEEDVFSLTGY
jgi:hypothetical protein